MGGGCVSASRTSIRLGAGSGRRPSRHDFGQLLALTVPLCIVASVAFALSPLLTPGKQLAILCIGTGL